MTTPKTPDSEEEKPQFNELQERRIREALESGPLFVRLSTLKVKLRVLAETGIGDSRVSLTKMARNYYGCQGRTGRVLYPQVESMVEEVFCRARAERERQRAQSRRERAGDN